MLLLLAALITIASPDDTVAPQPQPGEEIAFDVFRGDSRFGEHSVSFREEDGDLVAEVRVRLRAGLGPITVFRYEHDAVERWRNGRLVSLEARTLKDGDELRVSASQQDGRLIVESVTPDGPRTFEYSADALPSSHWHGYPSTALELINTETGAPLPVEIQPLGAEAVPADGGSVDARRFRLEGTLTVDLWYDSEDDWASTAFTARDQQITYRRRADPDASAASARDDAIRR